ncbi:MAG TPA: TIGR00266 family protein [Myxococcales bacterium]|nr:TIGR00266 family protein [Myxococcales bacterium]
MQTEVLQRPDFSMVKAVFDRPGESIVATAGTMVCRDTSVQMKTALRGGLLASAKRKLLGGESLFLNTFTATSAGEAVYLSPPAEGDIAEFHVRPHESLYIHSGAFLAGDASVALDTKWAGAKGLFGAGMFLLKAEGEGRVLVSAYGALHPVDVSGAGFICDNENIVAFTDGLTYQVRRVGGMKSLLLSGEGLVCHFQGRGRLWMQTRNPSRFAAWVHPFRRVKSKSSDGD